MDLVFGALLDDSSKCNTCNLWTEHSLKPSLRQVHWMTPKSSCSLKGPQIPKCDMVTQVSDETFCTQSQNYGGKSSWIFGSLSAFVTGMVTEMANTGSWYFFPKAKTGLPSVLNAFSSECFHSLPRIWQRCPHPRNVKSHSSLEKTLLLAKLKFLVWTEDSLSEWIEIIIEQPVNNLFAWNQAKQSMWLLMVS